MLAPVDVPQHPGNGPPAAFAGALLACAVSPPAPLPATLSAPTYSSAPSRARPAALRGNAGCSGRSTCPCTAPEPSPLSLGESASRSLSLAPIRQPAISMLLQPLAPSTHRPLRHPKDLCCRPPVDLLRHRLQQHVLNFIIRSISAAEYCWVSFTTQHHPPRPKADRPRVNSTGQLTY